jgi:hypothetical protein
MYPPAELSLDAHLARCAGRIAKERTGYRVAATLGTADLEEYRRVKKVDLQATTVNRHLSYLRSGLAEIQQHLPGKIVQLGNCYVVHDFVHSVPANRLASSLARVPPVRRVAVRALSRLIWQGRPQTPH